MIGIIMGKLFCTKSLSIGLVILILLILTAITVGLCVYAKKIEGYNSSLSARRNLSRLIKYSSIGFLVASILGLFLINMPILNILLMPTYSNDTIFTGIVSRYVVSEDTYKKLVLTDCDVICDYGMSALDCDILIYTDNYADIELGDRITFEGSLIAYEISDEYGMHSLINNIGYSAYVSYSEMSIGEGKIFVRDWIHNRTYNLLKDNLNGENADISYAILFGDKNGLDSGVSDMFSYAGISHILAVSGLHVSVLVAILWFLLDKIKCNRYFKLCVFGCILLFYAYLCYFSPSVCRACIMAMILALCRTFGWEYDSLSSLSLAGIIILLISPQMLFSLSFQLSFMCIFSIITLSPSLGKCMNRLHIPQWLGSSLAMSIAINIAVLPIATNSFGEVSLLGVLSNIVVLPLFSVVYVLLFVLVVIGVIIKPLGSLLVIPELFLHLIKVIANYVSHIPFGVLRIFNVSYWLVALIVLASVIIHYVMTRYYLKTIVVVGLIAVMGVIFGLNLIPKNYSNDILIETQYKSGVSLISKDGKTALVGSDISEKSLLLMLKEVRLKNIDEIYAFDLQLNELKELESICKTFNVRRVYIPNKYNYESVAERFACVETLEGEMKVCGYTLSLIEHGENIIAVRLTNENVVVLIPNLDNNKAENTIVKTSYVSESDYLLVDNNKIWDEIANYQGLIHRFNEKRIIIEGD